MNSRDFLALTRITREAAMEEWEALYVASAAHKRSERWRFERAMNALVEAGRALGEVLAAYKKPRRRR